MRACVRAVLLRDKCRCHTFCVCSVRAKTPGLPPSRDVVITFLKEIRFATMETTTEDVVGMVAIAVQQLILRDMSERPSARR